jgi:peroxiredoxin
VVLWLLVAGAVALAISIGVSSIRPAAAANIGKPAPQLSLPQLGGGELALYNLQDEILVLDFFATWCPPCREELPALSRLSERYKERGVFFIGVDSIEREDGGERSVARFVQKMQLPFPVVLDVGRVASNAYRVDAIPTTVFIDRRGVVRAVYQGAQSEATLAATLEDLLAD